MSGAAETVRPEPVEGLASLSDKEKERASTGSARTDCAGFANPARGEAAIVVAGETLVLRPSFEALVAAEGDLGPLFGIVERAAEGRLGLGEIAALFWHLIAARPAGLTRGQVGEAVVAGGLVGATPALKTILSQILQGR